MFDKCSWNKVFNCTGSTNSMLPLEVTILLLLQYYLFCSYKYESSFKFIACFTCKVTGLFEVRYFFVLSFCCIFFFFCQRVITTILFWFPILLPNVLVTDMNLPTKQLKRCCMVKAYSATYFDFLNNAVF